MQKEKLPKPLKETIKSFVSLKEKAREAGNAANREQTKLRNAVKDHWTTNGYPVGTYIHSDGLKIMFEASDSEVIDAEAVLERFEKGKISRESFLRMISVSMSEARKVLGGDEVAALTKTVVGAKADIRIAALPVEQANEEFIMVNKKIRIKNPRLGEALRSKKTEEVAPKRRIKIRGKK